MTPMIELSDVEVRFGRVVPLVGINLSIEAGELVGIVGPSGAGKTTLLRLLLGEISPTSGRLRLGTVRSNGRRSVGYVPQLEASERTFPLTVHGAVLLGAAATSARVPWFSSAEKAAASRALERLGIAELARRSLHELSGGQFQRVLFARALVSDPDLVLLDEPTSGIDLATRAEMLTLVGDLARDGLTVVLTTHDLNWVASHLRSVLRPDVLASTFGAEMAVLEHDGRPVVVDQAALVAERR
jgi:zinc/manganese transport system ATP-binding protein